MLQFCALLWLQVHAQRPSPGLTELNGASTHRPGKLPELSFRSCGAVSEKSCESVVVEQFARVVFPVDVSRQRFVLFSLRRDPFAKASAIQS
jgi:hypothetical protein